MSKEHFPSMRWHPETGEARVFNAAHEVPEGWLDAHPNDPKAKAAEPAGDSAGEGEPAKEDLTRAQIIAALTEGQIEFSKNARTGPLYVKLTEAVKANLAARNITFEQDAPTSALLELAKAPQE